MVVIVVGINLILGMGLLWLAWQTRKAVSGIASATQSINNYAVACQKGLENVPYSTLKAKEAISQLNDRYQALELQIEKWRSLLKKAQSFFQLLSRSNKVGKAR
jgi:ABC-type bacteriocin/lantibiotic exporter with double-glycine peptidase domain